LITVDSSALIAVLKGETERESFIRIMADAEGVMVSAGTYLETSILVDSSHDPLLIQGFTELLTELAVEVIPVTRQSAELARVAYQKYGKQSESGTKLNYGDCFSYALAAETHTPLLYKGNDFGHTDIQPAAARP